MRAAEGRPANGVRRARGFTLLEVVIAVLLLSLSLTALLQVQTRNISQAGQARDMTIAVALARAKVVDIEQMLFHQGLTTGEVRGEGDFADVGHPDVHYRYQISEVELDLGRITGAIGGVTQASGGDAAAAAAAEGEFTSMFSALAPVVEPLVQTIARSLRVMDLDISWQAGHARPHFNLRALVSQDDFSTMAASDAARDQRLMQDAGGAQGQVPGGAGTTATPAPVGGR